MPRLSDERLAELEEWLAGAEREYAEAPDEWAEAHQLGAHIRLGIAARMSLPDLLADLRDARAEAERLELERWTPLGDNHHNAFRCPYCNPQHTETLAEIASLRAELAELKPPPPARGVAHWPNCWASRDHHVCALLRIEELERELAAERERIERERCERIMERRYYDISATTAIRSGDPAP